MDLDVAIVLAVACGFLSIIGVKALKVWAGTETHKADLEVKVQQDQTVRALESKIGELGQALHRAEVGKTNALNRLHRFQKTYELEPDPDDPDDFLDPDVAAEPDDSPAKLSEIGKLLWPKMPKSIQAVIDKPEFQEAIAKGAAKNPGAIAAIIEKFTAPRPETPAAPGAPAQNSLEMYP